MITTTDLSKAIHSIWHSPESLPLRKPLIKAKNSNRKNATARPSHTSSIKQLPGKLLPVLKRPLPKTQPQQPQPLPPKVPRSNHLARNILILVGVGIVLALAWVISVWAQGVSMADLHEIESIIQSLTISDREQSQRLLDMKANMTPQQSRKVLVVGMIESLHELWENRPVVDAISTLCWVYEHGEYPDRQGSVDVHVLYKKNADDDRVVALQEELHKWGCQTTFAPEDSLWKDLHGDQLESFLEEFHTMSRYQRMSKLRSLQRNHILAKSPRDSNDYEIVVNVDLDIVHLPPVLSMISAMDHVSDNSNGRDGEGGDSSGSIICANGYETWNIAGVFRPHLFYDTMAAVDSTGEWAYTKYPMSVQQNIMFGQALFLRDILRRKNEPRPMQSCFGGVAMYDFQSWAYPACDYDRDKIQLLMKDSVDDSLDDLASPDLSSSSTGSKSSVQRQLRSVKEPPAESLVEQLQRQRWTLDPQYTLDGTPDGDACEHVVFQQCLYHASSSHAAHPSRPIQIGIQPDLLIERGAAVLSRPEDVANMVRMIGRVVMILTGISIIVFQVLRYMDFVTCQRKNQLTQKNHTA